MMPHMPEARQFKQCPVCGGNGYISCLFFGLEGYRVHCSFCGYYGPNGKTIDEAWMKVPYRIISTSAADSSSIGAIHVGND